MLSFLAKGRAETNEIPANPVQGEDDMSHLTGDSASEPYPSKSTAWRMVGILLIASMFAYLDRAIITLLLPMIRADLAINDTQFSLLQGLAFVITFALAALPMGWIADRFARNWLIAIGVAGWSAATVMCGLADTFTELFIARMGVGLGEACLAPAAVSLIADSFPRERRGLVIGVMSVGTPLGSGIAKVIGGLTLALIGGASVMVFSVVLEPWQAVFVIVGLPGLLVALGGEVARHG
jgi:MFS family permease